ncbi:MAG: hypothetical protein IT307_06385 [Chloroflexi bacterium]|nr:hypothetical protein [Chloroflexota bacterium]
MNRLMDNASTTTDGVTNGRIAQSSAPAVSAEGRGRVAPADSVLRGLLAAVIATLLFVASAVPPGPGLDRLVGQTALPDVPIALAAPEDQSSAPPRDPRQAAIQDVILRANAEQVDAIASRDASKMADTSTREHLVELSGINQDLLDSGVTSIALIQIEWGPIVVNDATATATTTETWTSTFVDGTTIQSRDNNVYTLVQENGPWKIQANDHPGALEPGGTSIPLTQPTQPTDVEIPAGQHTSRNWSGYAATGGVFTAVIGTWTVPRPATRATYASDAVWVGIGGVNTHDLIQAGTNTSVTNTGRAQFRVWVELLPQPARPVPLAVHPGDSITVTISQQTSDNWLVAFKNNTSGQTFLSREQYASTRSSAEWVVEAPATMRGLLPLDDFVSVGFTNGSTILNGQSATIAQAGAEPIAMINAERQPLAIPSPIDDGGASFTVLRTGNQPTTNNGAGQRSPPSPRPRTVPGLR